MGNAMYVFKTEGGYQTWENYPDSPDNSAEFPYQCISYDIIIGSGTYLIESSQPITTQQSARNSAYTTLGYGYMYQLIGGVWVLFSIIEENVSASLAVALFQNQSTPTTIESNCDIEILIPYTTTYIHWEKTREPISGEGIIKNRVRTIYHYKTEFNRVRCVKNKQTLKFERCNL